MHKISIRLVFLTLTCLGLAMGPVRAQSFLSMYEDLPLMPGLVEMAGSGVSFDSPAGRIVEIYAEGSSDMAAIAQFYGSALPQLGWVRLDDLAFRRDAELLRISVSPSGRGGVQPQLVRFSIAPE